MFKKWIIAFVVALLLVSGCSKNDKTDSKKENEVVDEAVTDEDVYQFPLTGIGTKEAAKGRSIAVMINNHPKARPQSGLGQADVVYELLAEGEVTRFLAIFQSERPEKIGPVRSARDYYMELAKGYDSVFIAHGYSPDAKALMDKGYVDNLNGMDYDGTLFHRASDRKAPHNSYTSFKDIIKGAKQSNYSMNEVPSSLPFLKTNEVKKINGEEADSAMISYLPNSKYNSKYEYDEDLEKYKRYSNGELTTDSGEPVLLDNIFIVETEHEVIDDAGRRSIDLTSGGRGYLLQKGKWKEVNWENIDGKILPVLEGKKAGLVPGRTWINVIPSNPGLEQIISFDVKE